MTFKIGDKVKINEDGHHRYGDGPSNPRGEIGEVVDTSMASDGWIGVQWKNAFNEYEHGTIDLVEELKKDE